MALTVTSRITINSQALRQINQNAIAALEKTAEELLDDVVESEVMPYDTGNLERDNTFVDYSQSKNGHVAIISNTPYARRLYFHPEYNFHRGEWFDAYGNVHGGNIAAGGKWFDPWSPGGTRETFVPETYAEIYRRLMGK